MTTTSRQNALQLVAPSPGTGSGAIGGSVLKAPIGTALPTSTGAVLNSAFVDLGYTTEAGIKDHEDRRQTDVFAWGGNLVGNIQQSYSRTYTIEFLQFLDSDVVAVAYGESNTMVTPATNIAGTEVAAKCNSLLLDTLSWVFQGFYQDALVLKVVPIARVVMVGDVDFTHTKFTTTPVTLKAFPDHLGNFSYLYTNDGVTTNAGS